MFELAEPENGLRPRLTVWYHHFSETISTVDELEIVQIYEASFFCLMSISNLYPNGNPDGRIEGHLSQYLTGVIKPNSISINH